MEGVLVMEKLEKTKIFKGKIIIKTGLHIGTGRGYDIGGVDSPVIKTSKGIPYIPGSSLKGKIRSLLEIFYKKSINDKGRHECNDDSCNICLLFGSPNLNKQTRLLFRDSFLDEEDFEKKRKEGFFKDSQMLTKYTELKIENSIDRISGKTGHGSLRQIERVPKGAVFKFEIVMNCFEGDNVEELEAHLYKGFELLANNYLGGSGSRGYGAVSIKLESPEQRKW